MQSKRIAGLLGLSVLTYSHPFILSKDWINLRCSVLGYPEAVCFWVFDVLFDFVPECLCALRGQPQGSSFNVAFSQFSSMVPARQRAALGAGVSKSGLLGHLL